MNLSLFSSLVCHKSVVKKLIIVGNAYEKEFVLEGINKQGENPIILNYSRVFLFEQRLMSLVWISVLRDSRSYLLRVDLNESEVK